MSVQKPKHPARPALRRNEGQRLMARLLREAVRPYLFYLLVTLLLMVVIAATTAGTAWLMDPVVKNVFSGQDSRMLWLIGAGVAAVYILKSGASYVQETLLSYVGQRVIADTQSRLFRHLIRHDVALLQAANSGSFVSHFTFDINQMRAAVSNALVGICRDGLSLVFLVGVMFYQDWGLSLASLILAPLTIIPLKRLGTRTRKISLGLQDEMAEMTGTLSQNFQAIRVIKAFGMEAYESKRFDALVERVFWLSYRTAKANAATQPIIDTLGGLAIAGVLVFTGARVMNHTTTPGAFFSFIAAVLMAYQPLRTLSRVGQSLQQGLAAAERIFTLLDTSPSLTDQPQAAALPRHAGAVVFQDVVFSYGGEKRALTGASFTAPAGKVTALVGPSGAGKSTAFSLIPRFYDPNSGRVLINDLDISTVTQTSLRDAMAIVSQDVTLFDDTILNNIRYGRLEASDDAVRAAASAAAADDFITALPQGYQTEIGEHGMRLSGGQRQRLAIARAILKDAPILLLDEATSALDTESERQIQEALHRLMQGRTTLVIAHRLSTIQQAHIIHVFDQGAVVESGNHQALLANGGIYARLHALQFNHEPV